MNQVRHRRRGFSLVELMIVISIIAILSTLFLAALDKAEQTAKAARTNSLVQKLHNVIMGRFDSYRSLRLPINADSKVGDMADAANERTNRFRQDVARRRMFAMRELLRMEMPDRYEDLTFVPSVYVTATGVPIRPYLWSAYQRRILTAARARGMTEVGERFIERIGQVNDSAECLYLIVTTGVDDSSLSTEHFRPEDIGDQDGDGMPEFRDAWGNPIDFLRWAPGFVSPAQPMHRYSTDDQRSKIFHNSQPRDPDDNDVVLSRWKVELDRYTNTNVSPARVDTRVLVIDQDDPFNPMRVGPVPDEVPGGGWARSRRWRPGDPAPEHGFILMPLIYSRGQDYEGGIDHCPARQGYKLESCPSMEMRKYWSTIHESDPYALYVGSDGQAKYRGTSLRDGRDFDNIHNHQISTR